jgi:hypothetical protein
MALTFLSVLRGDQACALFCFWRGLADFRLRPKGSQLGPRRTVGLIATIVHCGVLPYAEEFWR